MKKARSKNVEGFPAVESLSEIPSIGVDSLSDHKFISHCYSTLVIGFLLLTIVNQISVHWGTLYDKLEDIVHKIDDIEKHLESLKYDANEIRSDVSSIQSSNYDIERNIKK